MFKKNPKILSHQSALKNGNFVSPEYILNLSDKKVNLFRRYCPHRMYPMHDPGEVINQITCKFHNYQWDSNGIPINNNRKLTCGAANIGSSGLVLKDFTEPNHSWVKDLCNEIDLEFSHSYTGKSIGSWLWIMEVQADLLHIQQNGIHPELSKLINLDNVNMEEGNDWALQTFEDGWWLCIYPYTFVEYSKGCLAINYSVPHNSNDEFGFDWFSQFYFDPSVKNHKRSSFEKYFQDVYLEDLQAIEQQKGNYYPLTKSDNRLEKHCLHFGEWYKENLLT